MFEMFWILYQSPDFRIDVCQEQKFAQENRCGSFLTKGKENQMKNTENTRKAQEDKENRCMWWHENILTKIFATKTKEGLKRNETEDGVKGDRALIFKQKRRDTDTADNTKHWRNKLYHEQNKHTHFIICTILWGVKTFLPSLRESESSTSVSQHFVIIGLLNRKHSHNFRKRLKVFLIL